MMKEVKMADILPVEAVKSKIWTMFDILRSERIGSEDYHVVLFFLSVYKDGLFSTELLSEKYSLNERIILSLHSSDVDLFNRYSSIFPSFDPIIMRLSESGVKQMINALYELDKGILKEHFPDIFDGVLYHIVQLQGRYGAEFIQPVELTRFICSLAKLQPYSRVYNPFAGLASFGVYLDQGVEYFGQELNPQTWSLGALRIMAYQRQGFSKYVCDNSITNWVNPSEKFDLIVANPPLDRIRQGFEIAAGYRTFSQFLIKQGIDSLSSEGKLIAILPEGFLYRPLEEKRVRNFIVDHDLIDTIILLPGGLFSNTSIPLIIMVLSKKKSLPGKVRFVDAKKFVSVIGPTEKTLNDYTLNSFLSRGKKDPDVVRYISNDEIRAYDYNLSVPRYFQKKYKGSPLGNLGAVVRGQRVFEGIKGKFVRIRDLSGEALDIQLNLNNIDEIEIPRVAQKVSESCLLLASRWKTLKPTYFNYTGTPIFISPDIVAFKVDESKCDLVFLVNELHAGYVTEQLDSFRTGAVIPVIRKEDLLSVVVSAPNLNKQKLIVRQRLLELADEKKKELSFFTKIHGLENEIIEQNTYLRHTLAGPSSNLKDSISNMKRILLDKVVAEKPSLLDLKLSDKHMVSLGEYLSIIERDADKIVSAVANQLKVETGIESKELSPIEIIDFLSKYTNEYNDREDLIFKVEFDFDKDVFFDSNLNIVKAFILANEELLRDLFDNLIINAVKHAFLRNGNNRIEIYLMKNTENEDRDEIQILFSNTGKAFPEDFTINDFVRKGSKSGSNGGSGFGGWYINEIVKRLNGHFDIIDETGSEGLPGTDLATSFEFNFPIIETEENV